MSPTIIGPHGHRSPELTAPGDQATEETAPPKQELVGRITGLADCQWSDPQDSPTAAVPLGRKYELASGLMEISYDNGAKVILQGPCTYDIDSENGGFLSLGKLTARVETKEEGGRGRRKNRPSETRNRKSEIPLPLPPSTFVVRTPTAVVTDLGTEFGVEVSKEGNTTSHVFLGKVEMRWGGGKARDRVISLKANESASVEIGRDRTATLVRSAAAPAAFARRMPGRLPNNLVSYWNFDEGSGTIAHNAGLAGKKFDGTLMSAAKSGRGTLPIWTAGRFGRRCNSRPDRRNLRQPAHILVGQLLNVPHGGGLQFAYNATVSLWVKWNGPQPAAIGASKCAASNLYGCVLGRQRGGRDTNAIGLNYDGDPRSSPGCG